MINYRKQKKWNKLYNFTESRKSWFLLLFLLLATILSSLFFQYVKGMEPCYLCIIQRIGLVVAILGAFIGLLNPKLIYLKITGIITVLSGISLSLYASIKLVYMQANPPLFSSCGMKANQLMENYGLLKSLPILFQGSASCSDVSGSFLFFTFEQWTLSVFLIYALVLMPLSIFVIFKHFSVK